MKERIEVKSVIKSDDPEKLVVFRAASLQNEIRFYLNDTQYLTAVECKDGCSVRLEEKQAEECNKKSKISVIRENLRDFIKLFSIIEVLILGLYLIRIIDNILVLLIIIDIIYFVLNIVNVVIMKTMETSSSIKSKHSAEHMMANFLEINKRLPKNIEEVKKCSRFSPNCGSRELINGIAEELIWDIFAIIFTAIIVSHFSSKPITNVVVFLSTYCIVWFIVGKAITKCGMFDFIINPIEKVLTNIAQCANTTSKVKDRDIILAYSVAKPWLQVVYPEFYNENEDIFWKKYLEVNN